MSTLRLFSRANHPIGDIEDFIETVAGLKNYQFTYFLQFYDYSHWLDGCYRDLVGISACHYLHFTIDGVMAYGDNLDSPITPSPFKMITSPPLLKSPPYLTPSPISTARIQKFKRVKKPDGTETFWNALIDGRNVSEQPHLIAPKFEDHVSYLDAIVNVTHGNENPKTPESAARSPIIDNSSPEIVTLKKIGKLGWDDDWKSNFLEVEYEQYPGEIHYARRTDLVDVLDTGEEVKEQLFSDWENQHPVLKKRFIENSKPAQRECTSTIRNDGPQRKVKIGKKHVGNVLSSGRSQKNI